MAKRINQNSEETTENSSSPFPCLLNLCDYTSHFYYFDKEGVAEKVGYPDNIWSTFLGMAKCLLDTNVICFLVDFE